MSKAFIRKGIKNLKNTCFMNSILQLLVGIEEIRDFFIVAAKSDIPASLLNQFIALLQVYNSDSKLIIPKDLVEISYKLFIDSKPYTQQDAQEYFYLLIDKLNVELDSEGKQKIFENLFKGEITTMVKCELGEKNVKEEFLQLNLSIQDISNFTKSNRSEEESFLLEEYRRSLFCKRFRKHEALTVQDCIRQHFNNSENLMQDWCMVCQKRNTCSKQINLSVYPRYLIICLKRFDYKRKFSKLSNKVIASEYLQLYQTNYELVSVIQHKNFFWSGHYKIFCKDNNSWFECNDSSINPTTFNKVQNSEPYMLLYKAKQAEDPNSISVHQQQLPDEIESLSEADKISLRISGNFIQTDSNRISRDISSKRNTINSIVPYNESDHPSFSTKYHTVGKSTNAITPYDDLDQLPKYQSMPKPN